MQVLFFGSFGLTLAGNFGIISPYWLVLDFERIWNGFQVIPSIHRTNPIIFSYSVDLHRWASMTAAPARLCVNVIYLQIWRLFTSFFFFGGLGFPFLINMYFLYSYSVRLETGADG